MQKLLQWIKSNIVLLVIIVILLGILFFRSLVSISYTGKSDYGYGESMPLGFSGDMAIESFGPPGRGGALTTNFPTPSAPQVDVPPSERRVVTNSNISAVVEDVRSGVNSIQQKAEEVGGFMIYKTTNTPEEGGSGYISVRVPAERLDEMLEYIEQNSVKVVSVNISGNDVTDQYIDAQERLSDLERTKAIFEGILEEAEDVEEIMQVHERILMIQDQIDSLKGQIQYLDETSTTVAVTVNLSTDEYALPYVPSDGWNPETVFKAAVRSMVEMLRSIANLLIWIVVFAPIWGGALIIFLAVKKWWKNKKNKGSNP